MGYFLVFFIFIVFYATDLQHFDGIELLDTLENV
jgi:hypothetical protein